MQRLTVGAGKHPPFRADFRNGSADFTTPASNFPGQSGAGGVSGGTPSGKTPGRNGAGMSGNVRADGPFPGQSGAGGISGGTLSGKIPGRNGAGMSGNIRASGGKDFIGNPGQDRRRQFGNVDRPSSAPCRHSEQISTCTAGGKHTVNPGADGFPQSSCSPRRPQPDREGCKGQNGAPGPCRCENGGEEKPREDKNCGGKGRDRPDSIGDMLGLSKLLGNTDAPIMKLGSREIFPEDLLLLLLIIMLVQEDADPSLIAALIYVLAAG